MPVKKITFSLTIHSQGTRERCLIYLICKNCSFYKEGISSINFGVLCISCKLDIMKLPSLLLQLRGWYTENIIICLPYFLCFGVPIGVLKKPVLNYNSDTLTTINFSRTLFNRLLFI